jgi:hypothetical protein
MKPVNKSTLVVSGWQDQDDGDTRNIKKYEF